MENERMKARGMSLKDMPQKSFTADKTRNTEEKLNHD
jgi:hypothetical protein